MKEPTELAPRTSITGEVCKSDYLEGGGWKGKPHSKEFLVRLFKKFYH